MAHDSDVNKNDADGLISGKRGAPSSTDDSSHSEEIVDCFFGRFGTFILASPCDGPSIDVLHDSVMGALRNDPRVSLLSDVPLRPDWAHKHKFFPAFTSNAEVDDLLSGADHFHAVWFSDPITFKVVVPIKN
ncbi:hypothetical protein GCM10027596_33040 [Nocardioides korecus]